MKSKALLWLVSAVAAVVLVLAILAGAQIRRPCTLGG